MVFIATATITNLINEMIATSAKPTILEFATEVHKRFYPEQDIAFMNYFFELASQENEGKFVVPHQKLIEYGVATSTRSGDIKTRLESLGLEEGPDYTLRHVSQRNKSGPKRSNEKQTAPGGAEDLLQDVLQQKKSGSGGSNKKVYMLTPEAFKMCLMRAQRRSDQSIDVTKYAEYYLFLEKVVKYYDTYQITMRDLILGEKESIQPK